MVELRFTDEKPGDTVIYNPLTPCSRSQQQAEHVWIHQLHV